jgi:adenosylhomocysteine nucleosidase
MIGILAAMDIEAQGLKDLLQDADVVNIGPFSFYQGKLFGKDAVVAVCGIGKVSAAAGAAAMILNFSPSLVINTGVGGGLINQMKTGAICIADKTVHHDADVENLGFLPGQLPGQPQMFACDKHASGLLFSLAQKMLDRSVFMGTVASGDQFVRDDKMAQDIRSKFGAISVDMEAAPIGQVCTMLHTPYTVVRAISDNANKDASDSYETFAQDAADQSIKLLTEFFKAV